ncbi:MAG: hypothetical protein ACLR4E_09695 [Gemmiger formicilis]|uniref:hypothetical protein n=1 Tax=Gemmiger formicilis TaxID=745368 RepID=UPI003A1DC83B
MRSFFASIPNELFESATIDGCSPFGCFWRIMPPLSKPRWLPWPVHRGRPVERVYALHPLHHRPQLAELPGQGPLPDSGRWPFRHSHHTIG